MLSLLRNLLKSNKPSNDTQSISLVQQASFYLEQLKGREHARVIVRSDNEIEVEIQGSRFMLSSKEDVFVVHEVYAERCYGLQLPEDKKYVLIDIGMNIGVASCYFASLPAIEKIYGFEPFEPTFQQLQHNLQLNQLQEKCVAMNKALGMYQGQALWHYSTDFKGSSGKNALPAHKQAMANDEQQLLVNIADAAEEIQNIFDLHPAHRFIIKMDCEGGEYEIMQRLQESELLHRVSIFLVEWHEAEEPVLLQYLKDFHCFYHKISPTTGIIRAVKADAW